MLTLTEAWKESYRQYLDETENSVDTFLEDLQEANAEITKGFEYIEEYFKLFPVEDSIEESVIDNTLNREEKKERDDEPKFKPEDITSFLMKQLGQKVIDYEKDSSQRDLPVYNSVPGVATVEKLSDMKFPRNIIFFIQQLVNWVKRVVVYFIEKIKNIIRAITGRKDQITELNPDALKLQFTRAKKLETITSFRPSKDGKPEVVRAIAVDADDVKPYYALKDMALKEEFLDEGLFDREFNDIVVKSKDEKPSGNKPVVITIDLSKDLLSLKQLTQHFYDLYDGAFGANNEELFKADDLALVLKLFKETVSGLKKGKISTIEVGANAVEVSAIDSARIKDNLIRTNTNVENLKSAYMQTSERIKDITRIITHKQMLMLSGYGIDNKWLSSSTYEQMMEIMKTLNPRLKDAEKNEKELTKMQKQYEALSAELVKMQSLFNAYGNVTYTSVYQRRIIDLCNSARYMSQVVTLRLSGLALYIKEMKDIKDVFRALININK